jgi:hypothetical protein
MAKTKLFSLDTYEKDADKEYASYQIRVNEDTIVTLKNPLRIREDNRTRLFELLPELAFEDETPTTEDVKRITPLMLEVLQLVGDENVGLLVDRISGDLSVIMAIFQDYFREIGLGEASLSED